MSVGEMSTGEMSVDEMSIGADRITDDKQIIIASTVSTAGLQMEKWK